MPSFGAYLEARILYAKEELADVVGVLSEKVLDKLNWQDEIQEMENKTSKTHPMKSSGVQAKKQADCDVLICSL